MFSYVQRSFGLKMSEVPVWKAHIRWLFFIKFFMTSKKWTETLFFFHQFLLLGLFCVFRFGPFSQEFTNRRLFNEKDKNQSSTWGYRRFWVKRFHWEFVLGVHGFTEQRFRADEWIHSWKTKTTVEPENSPWKGETSTQTTNLWVPC